MNTADQDSIVLTTNSNQYSVAPGEALEIPVILANQGNVQRQLRLSVEGIPMVWVSTEQQVILIPPGEQRQVILKIQPPALPNVQVGRYMPRLMATSVVDSSQIAQKQVTLMVAGFEVKGRVGVLLGGVQYAVVPGEKLTIPVVLINQGLGEDTFQLSIEGLPGNWSSIPDPVSRLQPGEIKEAVLTIEPPRDPSTSASRYNFHILVSSQQAPDQPTSIDCTLTVAAFIEFNSSLEAAQPEQNLPAHVLIQNRSNIPATFKVSMNSLENVVTFVPQEPQQVNVPNGAPAKVEYTAQPSKRPLFGKERSYSYTVNVQESGGQSQTHEGTVLSKALLPVWTGIVGGIVLLVLIILLFGNVFFPGLLRPSPATVTPTVTSTASPAPTATQSRVDQTPLLIESKWYLVMFNNARSSPGVQEAFILFNPDGTLIGYTGCKDLNATYQTDYNLISIVNLNLGSGTCADATLQQQETIMTSILRSSHSYLIADTTLHIAGDAGFSNYSLTPLNRPEEITPPQAVINAVPQSQVGQVVVFDGSASTGQVALVSWRWEFGDNATASGIVVQHTYTTAGTFTVRLTVTDQRGQTGTSTTQIHILESPTATATPTLPPATATPPQPTAPPEQPTYTPIPTAEAPTSTPEPPPAPVPPQANISGPGKGFIGEPVSFDASASQPGSSAIVSFSWSMGNGQTLPASQASTVSYIYKAAGNYEVTVTVLDSDGLSSQATTNVHIDARLETDVWSLSQIDQKPLLPNTTITLQFKDGEVVGFAGCNEYSGEYTAVDNGDGTYTIAIDKLETTRLICAKDIMDQEEQYLTILEEATQATIKENEITLNSPTDELEFYLIEAP